MVENQFKSDSRNQFLLKFKTNWKTRPEWERKKKLLCPISKTRSNFRISANQANDNKNKLPSKVFFSSFASDTHEADERSQASNLLCLDPQKHKTYRKTQNREGNEAFFVAILMQFQFFFLFLLVTARLVKYSIWMCFPPAQFLLLCEWTSFSTPQYFVVLRTSQSETRRNKN